MRLLKDFDLKMPSDLVSADKLPQHGGLENTCYSLTSARYINKTLGTRTKLRLEKSFPGNF